MARVLPGKIAKRLPFLALALAVPLAGCGDGGGGGVASTNEPNTPPSPPSKPTNDDLVGTLVSEAFVNDARTQNAYMPITAAQPNTATRNPLTIEYKASTQTYTVSTQGRTQDFGPAEKDATLSTAEATVYSRSAGALTETLALSTNSNDPATPDAPLFRYVGSGLWQRTQTDASDSSATMDYFTYGVPTPASAMPKSGTATFGVRVDGEAGYSNYILVLKGGGRFSVDFASGNLAGSGTVDGYIAGELKRGGLIWSSQATLASGGTTFSGSFSTLYQPGTINGRFYGPNHEEFGAVWDSKLLDNVVATGTIRGRDTATMLSNNGLANLVINEDLGGAAMLVNYYRAGGTNAWSSGNLFGQAFNVSYSETAKALVVKAPMGGITGISATLNPASRDTALSNAAYDVYAAQDVTYGARTGTFRISRPGPANPVVALTYTGFGTFESVLVRPDSYPPYGDLAFAFGEATPASAVPTSGSATYSGVVLGYSGAPSDGTMRPYAISGDAHMAYNFGAATLTGTLDPVATDRDTGTAYALGAYTFTGQGTTGKATFAATFDKAINVQGLGNTKGAINGQFTGPHAEEFYASWHAGMIDPKGGSNLDMGGVIVGKQGQ